MGQDITSRTLPGGGTRREVGLSDGRRVSVVVHRDGSRELTVPAADGDAATTVTLSEDDAVSIAELLGGPRVMQRLAGMQRTADSLLVEQLPLPDSSPYAGSTLGSSKARSRSGASVVAVLRDGVAHPAPRPDFVLQGGDLVLAVGTREGIDKLVHLLDGTG